MIFRDDDISKFSDLQRFKIVHELFNKYNIVHTIAVITEDLERNQPLVHYIKNQSNISCQLHCVEHIDLTQDKNIHEHLQKGANDIERIFGDKPTILYPPWNKCNQNVITAAAILGMEARPDKISLEAYIRCNGQCKQDTINFHYWAEVETMFLEQALKIYASTHSNM